jgi:hypothetical protein
MSFQNLLREIIQKNVDQHNDDENILDDLSFERIRTKSSDLRSYLATELGIRKEKSKTPSDD